MKTRKDNTKHLRRVNRRNQLHAARDAADLEQRRLAFDELRPRPSTDPRVVRLAPSFTKTFLPIPVNLDAIVALSFLARAERRTRERRKRAAKQANGSTWFPL